MIDSSALLPTAPFQSALLDWYQQHGRHHLPWKQNPTPYHIWLSEIMLQQTQVKTVLPYYARFIENYPSVDALANAPLESILKDWAGLGYYARARNLHRTANQIVTEYASQFPETLSALERLPGIGRSTAGAILSMAFHQPAPILDGNVKRIFARLHCLEMPVNDRRTQSALWQIAEHALSNEHPAEYTQAMMDLGSLVCTRTQPDCYACPLNTLCEAHQRGVVGQYPVRGTKAQKPKRERYYLFLENPAGELLWYRRDLKGIWGGLWSLPEFASLSDVADFLSQTFRTNIPLEEGITAEHSFTHFQLTLRSVLAKLSESSHLLLPEHYCFTTLSQMQKTKGLPAGIQKLLQKVSMSGSSDNLYTQYALLENIPALPQHSDQTDF